MSTHALNQKVQENMERTRRGGRHLLSGVNVITNQMNLDPPTMRNYFGGQDHLRETSNLVRQLGATGTGFAAGLQAFGSYVTGGDTGQIATRLREQTAMRNSPLGDTGMTYNQHLGGGDQSPDVKKLMATRAEEISARGRQGTGEFGGKRIARAGVRSAGIAAGIAAVDFFNPFSFGWND
jgi:hypothetical protein